MSTTTLAQGSNPGLTSPMQIFYDRVFLDRAKIELRHDYGAQVKNIPMNSGKTVYFTRFTPLAVITSPLSEAANPTAVDMTASTISATLADYGTYTTVGSLYSMTSIETGLSEHVSVHGQNAGESIDQLIRAELVSGATNMLVSTSTGGSTGSTTAISTIHTSDTLTGLEVRRVRRSLMKNKAKKFDDGYYRAIIGPDTAMDLMGNTEWVNANIYATPEAIKSGVVGKLGGVQFAETNNQHFTLSGGFSTSATNVANVYSNFFCGMNGYGVINLGSISTPKVYVKNPGSNSTDNPLDQYSTVGWKMPFVAKTLNTNWVINLKTGATDGFNAA
jgi:N4-gp56 family major capsid protein